jgi:hypothetical protein
MLCNKEAFGSIRQRHDVAKRSWGLVGRRPSHDTDDPGLNLAHRHVQEGPIGKERKPDGYEHQKRPAGEND